MKFVKKQEGECMEEIYEELKGKLNWTERIVLRLFKKKIIKVCNIVRVTTINNILS